MRWLTTAALLLATPATHADVKTFIRENRPAVGHHCYAGGAKLPRRRGRALRRPGRDVHARKVIQVTNATLKKFTSATAKGYLEVVVPANKGHVFFRHGADVYDFSQKGFRCGPVRRVGSERYGMLVRLTPEQEGRLQRYLKRLKDTGGRELGAYDFTGCRGHHCVSWLMRQPLDGAGRNLVQLLGGQAGDGMGMPAFSRFVLQRAEPVEAVAVYNDRPRSATQLSRMQLQLMSSEEIVRAYREHQRRAR